MIDIFENILNMVLYRYLNENGTDVPQCFIYGIILVNTSLKPNQLIRYLEIKRVKYKIKTRDFLKKTRISLYKIKNYQDLMNTVEDKVYLKCS